MTVKERASLVSRDFDELWAEMWGSESADVQYKKDKETSRNKLIALREGIAMGVGGRPSRVYVL